MKHSEVNSLIFLELCKHKYPFDEHLEISYDAKTYKGHGITLTDVQKWLREHHYIDVIVDVISHGYYFKIYSEANIDKEEYNPTAVCDLYEDALELGIGKVLTDLENYL